MNWTNIIKLRREEDESRVNRLPERRKRKIPMSGGKEPLQFKDTEEDSLDTDEYDKLAEETREDLVNKVMDKIDSMSKEELIELLIDTKGKLEMKIWAKI